MTKNIILTSESVGAGHPDKLCDIVSDSLLDALFAQDNGSRVAVETWVKDNTLGIIGEVTTNADVNFEKIARNCVERIGYTNAQWGMDFKDFEFIKLVGAQSQEIAQGVDDDADAEQGAGDQGIMWGYATNETPEFMPLPLILSHQLVAKIAELKAEHTFLRPDCKSQISAEYENGKPKHITTVVMAVQHDEHISEEDLQTFLLENVIEPVCGQWLTPDTKFIINGTGKFEIGGPKGDAGLTGRKIIVDTYGGLAKHGGGAFSGKDPSKVDRSAAYMARYIAKNLVAAELCERCEVQLSYCIGVAEPTSFFVNTFGTGVKSDEELASLALSVFGLKPKEIIAHLDLLNPKGWCYADTAVGGHFGRDVFPWEKIDMVSKLR